MDSSHISETEKTFCHYDSDKNTAWIVLIQLIIFSIFKYFISKFVLLNIYIIGDIYKKNQEIEFYNKSGLPYAIWTINKTNSIIITPFINNHEKNIPNDDIIDTISNNNK